MSEKSTADPFEFPGAEIFVIRKFSDCAGEGRVKYKSSYFLIKHLKKQDLYIFFRGREKFFPPRKSKGTRDVLAFIRWNNK